MIKYKITPLGKFVSVCAASAFILLIIFFIPSNDKPKSQKFQTAHSEAVPVAPKANVAAPETTIAPKNAAPTTAPANKKKQSLTTKKKYAHPINKAGISVSFASGSSDLDEKNKNNLSVFWKEADKNNNFIIAIEGNCATSTSGDANQNNLADGNKELAKKRATAVEEFLTQLGVPKNNIKVISSCEKKPYIITIPKKAAH
jgi:outer membrane protein OmpA-like peptidoglycan-associated protein